MIKILLFVICVSWACAQSDCRFAHSYTQDEILHNVTSQNKFIRDVLTWEAKFIRSVGVEEASGFTYDGQRVDY